MREGEKDYDWWQFAGIYEDAYRKALKTGSVADLEKMTVLKGGEAELQYIRGLARLCLPHVEFRGKALDVGCGAGHMTRCLADAGYEAKGLDISESGVALARRHYPGHEFFVANATAEPQLPDPAYDFILFRGFHPFMRIHDFVYQSRLLDAYRRRLSRTGIIAIINPTPSALDFKKLHVVSSAAGVPMIGPFYPNLHKRLRLMPRSRADVHIFSAVSGLIGNLFSWGLMSVTLLAAGPDGD